MYIGDQLTQGEIETSEEFYIRLINVFQLVVDNFESTLEEKAYMKNLVYGCKHLVNYSKWLCLETLPLVTTPTTTDTTTAANTTSNTTSILPSKRSSKSSSTSTTTTAAPTTAATTTPTLYLTTTHRDDQRQARIQILQNTPIDFILTLCRKLIKDIERCKNKKEQFQLNYFLVPVSEETLSDYSVYVRKPIDLGN